MLALAAPLELQRTSSMVALSVAKAMTRLGRSTEQSTTKRCLIFLAFGTMLMGSIAPRCMISKVAAGVIKTLVSPQIAMVNVQ
jgi:hypothetical protein